MLAIGECILGIRGAVAFLTRIPMGMVSQTQQRWAAAHFPLVGAFIGALGVLVWRLTYRLDAEARVWLVIAALLLVTGALHEDGLADTADALGGAYTRERLFAILKDSRIGTFGAAALIVGLLLRAILLSRLLVEMPLILVMSQAISRLAPVLLLASMPYVTASDVSRSQSVVRVDRLSVVVAIAWTVGVSWVLVSSTHLAMLRLMAGIVGLAVMTSWLAWRFARRAGGVTGDFLGATQQLGELAFFLGLALCGG